MSKIQLSQPLMHTNLSFSDTLLIYMPLSRPCKQEENLFKRKERRHHCMLFRHYLVRGNSPNLRRTTHETLDLKRRGGDRRKLTRQALGTLNCDRHHGTIFQLQDTQLLLKIREVKLQVFEGPLKTASGSFKLTRKVHNNKLYI